MTVMTTIQADERKKITGCSRVGEHLFPLPSLSCSIFSFSVFRFRSVVFDEDNTASAAAAAGGGGISVTLSIAFGSLFSLDVFGLSFSLYVFGLPCSMKIIRHRRRHREEAGSNVVQFTVIS